ncbi:PREDICTED: uncharacterized protein LOC103329684 [Prunus mume]|uniref:Uncharacterized protein LOC103329684 n=1 Tax=Prunus mume TaxID=102107 RepID=A0ABM0NVE2_PRUMU|nr:PREDICTED: uncharacterized protein LOC103329684 [Prunus mume]
MFDILFGWRKASKCKRLIKQVQCRLKLLKNKRQTIVRQLREDVAELIKHGHEDKAFNRVGQIIKDECIVAVYELLDNFCEFILIHLPYIRRHKDCPNDINEAVSSLIYASARCGDLPELRVIRKLFGERYGQKFAVTALELFPGNLVNHQVIEKLSLKSVTDDMKQILVNEIARNYCIKPEVLAIEYYSEWQQKVKEISGHRVLDTDVQTYNERTERSELQIVNVEEIEREVVDVDSNVSSTSAGSSLAMLVGPTISESLMHDKPQMEENCAAVDSPSMSTVGTEESQSSTVGSTTRDGDIVIYMDDIEEVQSFTARRDGDSQDQRIFKFKAIEPKRENLESSCDLSYVDCYETWSESSESKSSRRSWKGSGKRPRKRSVSQENQCLKDNECLSYYGRKQQKKTLVGEIESSYSAQKCLKQPCHMKMGANILSCKCGCDGKRLSCGCSLEHPCYFCTGNGNNVACDVLPWKQKRGITTRVGVSTHGREVQLNKGMEWPDVPQEPMRRRSCGNEAMVYNVFTYPDHHQPNMRNKALRETAEELESSIQCRRASYSSTSPNVVSSWSARKEMVPPYIRAVTMPPERAKDNHKDDFQRSFSDAFQYPTHVHPKLPDYDDIAAKFMALKKERLQSKPHCSNRQL